MEFPFLCYIHVLEAVGVIRSGWYRVVWSTKAGEEVVLVRLSDAIDINVPWKLKEDLSAPLLVEKSQLVAMIDKSRAELAEVPTMATPGSKVVRQNKTTEEIEKEKLLREFNEFNIRTLLLTGGWTAEMKRLSKRFGFALNSVKRLVLAYLRSGHNYEVASQRKTRVKGTPRTLTEKLGRKRNSFKAGHSAHPGINSVEHEQLVKNFIEARGPRRGTIPQQHRSFYDTYASKGFEVDEKGNPKRILFPDEERIRLPAFRALLKRLDFEGYVTRNDSEQAKEKKQSVLIGNARSRGSFPGHTYIIDATVADIYIVSAYDRRRIIGRPIIYVVIDLFSSVILAIYVTLWGPNFNEARNAIFMALSDKKDYLRYLGLEEFQEYFPQGVRPNYLLYDRGELLSKNGETLGQRLQFSCLVAAAYKAVWKSIVERNFGVINTYVLEKTPGHVVKEHVRGEPDYRLSAIHTLTEIRRLMAIHQIRWNSGKKMGKHLTPSMILDPGHEPSPIWMWNWGLRNCHGSPFFFTRDQLIVSTLDCVSKPVKRTGFELEKMKLVNDWMKDHRSICLANSHPSEAMLAFSPENPKLAFCRMQGETSFRDLFISDIPDTPEREIWVPSREDIEDQIAIKGFKDEDHQSSLTGLNAKLGLAEAEIGDIARRATKTALRETAATKAERTRDMTGARHAEDQYERTGVYPSQGEPVGNALDQPGNERKTEFKDQHEMHEAAESAMEGWGE
ncbi:hypothetical protein [Herbaspirillum camelliae]|uniref:hypothetical protein n=1 Tax=Herbaspirillum camelliae TaxID=1892903 RepID=UPI00094A0227|nr:hypothetical protein [Herbaspirillum camelliae]